MHYALCTMHPK